MKNLNLLTIMMMIFVSVNCWQLQRPETWAIWPEKKQNQNPEVKSIKSNDDTIYNPYNFMHDAIIDLARKQNELFTSIIGKENFHPLMNMDISELKNGYEIHADLPGVKEEDVKIKVKDGILSITASRCKETDEECENQQSKELTKEIGVEQPLKTFHRKERIVGEFTRSMKLPNDANAHEIKAILESGVLTLSVGKSKDDTSNVVNIEVNKN